MKICSITPVLNEEFFIENFIISNSKYVDEMIISDGGSKDNTLNIIQKYINMGFNIKLIHHTQGKAYTDEFNQDSCLNAMIDLAKDYDYIIQLDADEELLNHHVILKEIIELYPNINLFGLPLITFWGNENTVRVNVENDMHWYPTPKYCIFKNIPEIRFKNKHHAFLYYNDDNIFKYGSKVIELPFNHFHYLRPKENDNRLSDIGGNWLEPNWKLTENTWQDNPFGYVGKYAIKTIPLNHIYFNIAEATYKTIISAINYKDKEIQVLKDSLTIRTNENNNLKNQLEEAIIELKNRQISINVLKEKLIKLEQLNGSTPTNISLG